MAAALKDTPVYTDQVIAWQNQRLWWLLCGVGALLILSFTANVIIELKPVAPPYGWLWIAKASRSASFSRSPARKRYPNSGWKTY
jgi:hypothetical protein